MSDQFWLSEAQLERIKPYRNEISVLISESDAGLYHAVNKGIKRATGDIIAILNGDDYYSHDSVLSAYAEKFEDHDLAAPDQVVDLGQVGIRPLVGECANKSILPPLWIWITCQLRVGLD